MKFLIAAWFLLWLTITCTVIFVAAHFILKYW